MGYEFYSTPACLGVAIYESESEFLKDFNIDSEKGACANTYYHALMASVETVNRFTNETYLKEPRKDFFLVLIAHDPWAWCDGIQSQTFNKFDYVKLEATYPSEQIPEIVLAKSASPSTIQEGETTTISIRVENTGAGDAKSVEVIDTIPTGFKIISGSKSASFDKIKSNEYRTYQYTLKAIGTGRFVLDPATATYSDDKGNSYSSASNSVTITSEASSPPIVPTEEEKGIPGFEGVFAIAGLLAVAYLLRRRK